VTLRERFVAVLRMHFATDDPGSMVAIAVRETVDLTDEDFDLVATELVGIAPDPSEALQALRDHLATAPSASMEEWRAAYFSLAEITQRAASTDRSREPRLDVSREALIAALPGAFQLADNLGWDSDDFTDRETLEAVADRLLESRKGAETKEWHRMSDPTMMAPQFDNDAAIRAIRWPTTPSPDR